MAKTRRSVLRELGCAFLSRAAFITGAERLFMMNSLAGPAAAAAASNYKALVCIFLFGGNDANNMVIPYDNFAAPGGYKDTRGSSGIAISQDQLLQISVPSAGAKFGLHPSMPELQALFNSSKLAIAVNVGTLFQPVTRTQYQNNPKVRPYQLFSHADQQSEWQTSYASSPYPSGWAGRVSDVLGVDPSGFPTISSVAGVTIFSAGRSTRPIVLPPAPTPLNQALRLKRTGDDQPGSALTDVLAIDLNDSASPILVTDAAKTTRQAIDNSLVLKNANPTINTVFPNTPVGNQLLQVAKLIQVCSNPNGIGIKRQIFFCSLGGFDTHNNQGSTNMGAGQPRLLLQLSQAMNAFYNATVELNLSNQVTTFTMSDFSRTFKPAGDGAATGTDHAWGSHHFIVGDAVRGGNFYGTYPTLALAGPDDTDAGAGARGRWIPGTAVDQYAATLARWFGVSDIDLSSVVFPNLHNFATSDLGFMGGGTSAAATRV